jgi:hypothetical protein
MAAQRVISRTYPADYSLCSHRMEEEEVKSINEATYIQFTKLTTRLLDAHTTHLAHAIQLEIVEWLRT